MALVRVPGEAAGAGDPRFSDSYFFSSTNLSLAYARRWNHVSLAASSSHNGFYYPDFHELTGVGHAGRVGLSATSGQRFSVNASQSFSYSPFYGMGSMFGLDPTANPFIWNPLFGVSQRAPTALGVPLGPETITTFELEHSHDLTEELRVSVAGYYNLIDKLVVLGSQDVTPPCMDSNGPTQCLVFTNSAQRISALGAEAQVRWQPGRYTLVDLGYSFVWLESSAAKGKLVLVP